MRITNSIKKILFIALVLGIIAPMLSVGYYTIKSSEQILYKDFDKFRARITADIGKAMTEPLFYFSPNNGTIALEIIKHDDRISKIEVFDLLTESEFIILDFPNRKQGNSFINQTNINKNGELLGSVRISFNDRHLQEILSEKREIFIFTCIFTLIVSCLILTPLLYLKVLRPLKRLLYQSKELENEKFELTFTWDKEDEINNLGRSFEKARLSIINLIEELKEKNKQLEKLYITDQLTTLYNRYKLDDALSSEMERANKDKTYQFGIILLDLDHFKQINDTYGHQVGDSVLRSVASIIEVSIRPTDIAGRWGGEEFLLIIPDADRETLLHLSEKIRKICDSKVFEDQINLTASFGVTLYHPGELKDEFITRVDEALYRAKAKGRNEVICKF